MKKSKVLSVIMGGGRGKRLHPLTKLRCKPAVPLAGKYRLVDIPISNCLNSGLNRIYVLTQFNTASLHRHIQESYKFDPFGGGFVDILSAEQTEDAENWYQGTCDAVRQNLMHFSSDDDNDLFLILSGDQLYSLDLKLIIEQHLSTNADITIAAKAIPSSCVGEFGVLKVNDDLSVSDFIEKPQDSKIIENLTLSNNLKKNLNNPDSQNYCLASMGIYVFNKNVIYESLVRSKATDFGKELIPELLNKAKIYSYIFDGYWEDIGTVSAFFDANIRLTDKHPPFDFYQQKNLIFTHARYLPASRINNCYSENTIFADGCKVSAAKISQSIVGIRSIIGKGTQMDRVIMMGADYFESEDNLIDNAVDDIPNIGIGDNCVIKNAIIDKNARIGNNVVLDPENVPDGFDQGVIVKKDGILIVLKKGIVPNNTVIK